MLIWKDLVEAHTKRIAWEQGQRQAFETFVREFRGAVVAHMACPDEVVELRIWRGFSRPGRFTAHVTFLGPEADQLALVCVEATPRWEGRPFDFQIQDETPIPYDTAGFQNLVEAVARNAHRMIEHTGSLKLEGDIQAVHRRECRLEEERDRARLGSSASAA